MGEIFINDEELDYLTNVPQVVCEEPNFVEPKISFEEEAKDCMTLDQFSEEIDKAIKRLIPNP